MRNKWIYIIIVCLIIGASIGLYCVSSKEKEDVLVTKEYLIEACGFSEKDYIGINLYDFIKEFQITKKSIDKINVKELFAQYKSIPDNVYDEDAVFYEYLYEKENAGKKITQEELEQIKVIGLSISRGIDGNESIIVDYEREEIYYGIWESVFWDGSCPSWTTPLSPKKKSVIDEMWNECDILSWEQEYIDYDDDMLDACYSWNLFIELENGEIRKYSGEGTGKDIAPEGYDILVDTLDQWNVRLISVDYLYNNVTLSDEECNGVDLENFIKEKIITFDKFWKEDINELLSQYKKEQGLDETSK